jgi:hypothetical protein
MNQSTVLNVLLTESLPLIVVVHKDIITFSEMMVKTKLNVLNVDIDVKLVLDLLTIVTLVQFIELWMLTTIVSVLLVDLKMMKVNVYHVHLIVLNVLMLKLVLLAQKELSEIHHPNVHVFLDIMKLKTIVMLVTSDV